MDFSRTARRQVPWLTADMSQAKLQGWQA
jgi:hypothetical protein